MASFGEKLKREREKKKITLDEVALSTKIGTRMLQALEEEKFDLLPGGVFNKGFVRAYARFLGIDEAEAIADYNQASGAIAPPPVPDDIELRAIAEKKEKERRGHRAAQLPWSWVAFLLLMVALALAVWGFYSRERTRDEKADHPQTAPPAAVESKPLPVAAATPEQIPSQTAPTPSTKPPVTSAAPESPPTPEPRLRQPAVDSQATPPRSGAFVVLVRAREESWVSIVADGQTTFQDILAAGSEKEVRAQRTIVVRAGNIGGLDISFNGNRLPLQGDFGEAKTLTFDSSGLEQQAAKPPG